MVNRHAPTAEDNALIEQITGRNLAAATGYLAQLQQRLPPETRTRLLVSDNVIASLHDLVEQENVDLLILSAHGHSGGSQRPFGNVATNFITYGLVPLLIVQDMPSPKTGPSSQKVGGQTVANANYAH
jgi:nucleotide-binding universal stress UspA family protein